MWSESFLSITAHYIIKDRALETDYRIDISSLCNDLHYMTSYLSLNSNSNLRLI